MGLIHKILYSVFKNTIGSNLKIVSSLMDDCETVADVGCGNGLFALFLKSKLKKTVTCLDLKDYRWKQAKDLRFNAFDGKTIPYKYNTFDCSTIFLVLHHTDNPLGLLKECLRISKKKVIILEETYINSFQKILMIIYDIVLNFFIFGQRISIPNFYAEPKWIEVFKKLDVKEVEILYLPSEWWRIPRRILFTLRK